MSDFDERDHDEDKEELEKTDGQDKETDLGNTSSEVKQEGEYEDV